MQTASSILHPHTALLPNTTHHRYSTMTQPCHKDTPLNRQCCDGEHERRKRGEGRQCKRDKNNMKGRTQSEHGDNTHPPHPPFNRATEQTEGEPQHTDGGRRHSTGSPATQPPFTHHATHHPLCHPTIHDGPTLHHEEGGADRGYPTTRTPQTHSHPHHTTHLAKSSA